MHPTPPSSRYARLLIVFLLASGLGVACGGGGGGAPGGEEPPYDPPPGEDLRLNTDPAGSELSLFPVICSDAHRVYAVWYDRRSGLNTDVYFNRSLDAGVSWLATDLRLDTDLPGAAGSNVPRMACTGDRVYVVWSDQRGGGAQIRFNRSLDAGSTWLADDVRLDTDPTDAGASRNVAICAVGTAIHVTWEDSRDGAGDIYYQRSLDGGSNWLPSDVRLDTDVAGASVSRVPQIACDAADVLVVWEDYRDGEADVRIAHSADGGFIWPVADRRLDTDGAGTAGSRDPQIACEGTGVCVVWSDDRDGETDVYANASVDHGTSWLMDDVRVDTDAPGSASSEAPRVAMEGARAFVVWEDDRFARPSVYFAVSEDAGATWGVEDRRLETNGQGQSASISPDLAVSATHVHVVWADDRQGAFDVVLRSSADGGARWRDREIRLDTGPAGAADALFPRVAADGATARAVWADTRHGPGDVYFSRAAARP